MGPAIVLAITVGAIIGGYTHVGWLGLAAGGCAGSLTYCWGLLARTARLFFFLAAVGVGTCVGIATMTPTAPTGGLADAFGGYVQCGRALGGPDLPEPSLEFYATPASQDWQQSLAARALFLRCEAITNSQRLMLWEAIGATLLVGGAAAVAHRRWSPRHQP